MLRQLIEQNHIEQRLVYLDTAVVIDKTELAKAVHEEADTRPGGADHLRECFLRDGRNEGFRFSWLAEFRHQQEDSRQTLFAGVEKLIDEVSLGSHAAGQEEFQKYVGEGVLLVHHLDHLLPSNPERSARVDRGGRGQAQSGHRRDGFLSDEIAAGENRDRCLFAFVRNYSKFCPAALEIKDRVCRISLDKEVLSRLQIE